MTYQDKRIVRIVFLYANLVWIPMKNFKKIPVITAVKTNVMIAVTGVYLVPIKVERLPTAFAKMELMITKDKNAMSAKKIVPYVRVNPNVLNV